MTLEEREAHFMKHHIGDRTREQLATELYGIYLSLRGWCGQITDDNPDDPWPIDLHPVDPAEGHRHFRVGVPPGEGGEGGW